MKSKNYFDPFGAELPLINSTYNRIKYTNQERDTFTNYDYMHVRFYSSSIGRFLRPDPINGTAENPQSWNLYAYVQNNPVNATDPTGKSLRGTQPFGMGMAQEKLPSPASPSAWLYNMIGGSGTAWVTTTWWTTINYYESNGAVSTSVTVTWSTSEMYDIRGGMPVPLTFSTYEDTIQVVASSQNADTALSKESNMSVVTESVKAILMNGPNVYEQLIMLAIGMRESRLGLSQNSANNPCQLAGSSKLGVSQNINENVSKCYQVLEWAMRKNPDNLTEAIKAYNGSENQIDYEKRWRMTYENIIRTLTWNDVWGETWL